MSDNKTEEPTQKKLDDARKKGQVASSKDVVHVWVLFFGLSVVLSDLFNTAERILAVFDRAFDLMNAKGPRFLGAMATETLKDITLISLPYLVIAILSILLGTFFQTRFLVSFESIKPSFKKFDVVSNVKNMFNAKSLVQIILGIFKIVVVGTVSILVFKSYANDFMHMPALTVDQLWPFIAQVLRIVFYSSFVMFVVLALMDYVIVLWNHMKQMRMSKQEVKQEYKDQEGDPYIKSQRKQEGRRLIDSNPAHLVRRSAAVVTNPTHIAICLAYDPQEHSVPFVLAIRDGIEAQDMMKLAREMGVPVIRHIPFARGIYRNGLEMSYVPSEYIKLSALIIRSVMKWTKLSETEKNSRSDWVIE
ncbi:EscU/YscU/HrcU family type III secretion system export apparatus switch protein [Limnobacter alexandrii]|jgi:type III secretion protein U|uniref:EscU/YscU/HrcU family type III secretion system export apparatus switch protein n=1 Tax=Limnobacter alexandrii TaxID=2570352 RepID=UPI001108BB99|nr:EscU/YscU/HrcU family type III secretion system export apparatus switch protein [Limnobacter alexandrii]